MADKEKEKEKETKPEEVNEALKKMTKEVGATEETETEAETETKAETPTETPPEETEGETDIWKLLSETPVETKTEEETKPEEETPPAEEKKEGELPEDWVDTTPREFVEKVITPVMNEINELRETQAKLHETVMQLGTIIQSILMETQANALLKQNAPYWSKRIPELMQAVQRNPKVAEIAGQLLAENPQRYKRNIFLALDEVVGLVEGDLEKRLLARKGTPPSTKKPQIEGGGKAGGTGTKASPSTSEMTDEQLKELILQRLRQSS